MVARTLVVAAGTGARVTVTCVAVVFGLVIGSFLNVVVYRVPRGLSVVRPGSFCPSCGTPIASGDNVPVLSWLILRAKCRHCGEPISARYPIVELVTGALFGAVSFALGAHWAVPGMCVLGATALASAAIELDGLAPPPSVSLIGTGLGALLLSAAAVADRRWWHLGGMLIGLAVTGSAAVLASRATKRRPSPVGLWPLTAAGAAMGWVGPVGTVVGVSTFAVVVVGRWLVIRQRPRHDRSERDRGVAVAAGLAAAAALIGAFVAGGSIGL